VKNIQKEYKQMCARKQIPALPSNDFMEAFHALISTGLVKADGKSTFDSKSELQLSVLEEEEVASILRRNPFLSDLL